MLLTLRRLRRQEAWTRAMIDAHQAKSLARLRAYAYANSSFYRKFHGGLTGRPLHELPVLTKPILHDNFDEIVTDQGIDRATVAAHVQGLVGDERFRGEYVVNGSSGTSGSSSYILFNRTEWANVLASFSRFERHVGTLWGALRRPRMAVIASATPWHISARIGATVRSSLLPILRVDVGEPIDTIVQQLNAYQPQILATYASMTAILADEQTSGRLQIAPQRIVSAAEILSPALRQRVDAVWGDIVFDQYGATEGGTFAVECESQYRAREDAGGHTRGLHLFEDLFIFEVVDEQNGPVPPGRCGDKVLLTVLFNHTLPLIRYELSDRVKMADLPCSCGCAFALIEEIQGRRESVLYLPGRDGGAIAVHPMVFYRILDATSVTGWQVAQEGDTLTLRLSGGPQGIDTQALVDAVRDALARLNAVVPEINLKWMTEIERGTTGKAAHIVPAL